MSINHKFLRLIYSIRRKRQLETLATNPTDGSYAIALEDIYGTLTDEQKERIKACKTPEELLAAAKENGYELSDEELEGIAGGGWDFFPCDDNVCTGNEGFWS